MNKILLTLTLLTINSTNAFAGFALECTHKLFEATNAKPTFNNLYNLNVTPGVLLDYSEYSCTGLGKLKNTSYMVEFVGAALPIRFDLYEKMILSCPSVRKSRIVQDYYGVKVAAGVFAGADVGVVFSKRFGTCFISGVGSIVGASAAVGKMIIRKNKEFQIE